MVIRLIRDKGIDVKLRLWEESFYLPQVALGIRDFTCTGLFDSEFLVASKRWGDFDFSLGMGWGNMAQSGNIQKTPSIPSKNLLRQSWI